MTFNVILCSSGDVGANAGLKVALSNGRDLARLVSDLRDDELIAVDGSLSKKVVALEP